MSTPTASAAIRFLRRVIAPSGRRGRFGWHHIVSALHHVGQDPSVEAELLLEQVVRFTGLVYLDPRSSPPHAMPPEAMMQSLALQSLAQRGKRKHKALIDRVARTTRFDLLAAIARSSTS